MLTLVGLPLGSRDEPSKLAVETLRGADIVLGESFKEAYRILSPLGLRDKPVELLNEHSVDEDLRKYLERCKTQNVVLISDSGTPGFCDPGNDLIALCRKENLEVKTVVGPSCLMGLLALASVRLHEFLFKGFLPRETGERQQEWQRLGGARIAQVIMDTPYRLRKTLEEMAQFLPKHRALIVCNLTSEDEWNCEGRALEILQGLPFAKAEFLLLIYPLEPTGKIVK